MMEDSATATTADEPILTDRLVEAPSLAVADALIKLGLDNPDSLVGAAVSSTDQGPSPQFATSPAIEQAASIISTMSGNGRITGTPPLVSGLAGPMEVVDDGDGGLWFIDGIFWVRHLDANGEVATLGRDGGWSIAPVRGSEGVSPAAAIARGPDGLLYLARGNQILAAAPDGPMTVFAGLDTAGFSGDGGPATEAEFQVIRDIAFGPNGSMLVADGSNRRVRRIDPSGIVTTIAGNGLSGNPDNIGGTATELPIRPTKVAAGPDGEVYIASLDGKIWRLDPDGVIRHFAGSGLSGLGGDGGPATSATFGGIFGSLAVTPTGELFIADPVNNRVRRIDSAGTITTAVGNGLPGSLGEGGPASAARLGMRTTFEFVRFRATVIGSLGVSVDDAGQLLVADSGTTRVLRVESGNLNAVLRNSTAGDGQQASEVGLGAPQDVAHDSAGNTYVSDGPGHVVRKIRPDGTLVTVAGTGEAGSSGDSGPATEASLFQPGPLAVDLDNNLYIADVFNRRIRRVSPDGIITTIADGNGSSAGEPDSEQTPLTLGWVRDLAADEIGTVYFVDTSAVGVRAIVGDNIVSVAGLDVEVNRIGLDVDGNLYYAYHDASAPSYAIHYLTPAGADHSVLESFPGLINGVEIDSEGSVFAAAVHAYPIGEVIRVEPGGGFSVIAGGTQGPSGDGGPATEGELLGPVGLDITPSGDVVVAESFGARLRHITAGAAPGVVVGGVRRTDHDDDPPELPVNHEPDWGEWHPGDVHTHAAGDTNLDLHPQCANRTEQDCARYLVSNTLQRAKRFGTEWIVFTEHAPWLGYTRDPGLYDPEQAARQWEWIRDALDELSDSDVRGLIGAELGTAIPACTSFKLDIEFDLFGPPISVSDINSPGHFGVYYAPSPVENSMLDCNETGSTGYAGATEAVGGWGGINHPDNVDGGSPWWCLTTDPETGEGMQHQPQILRQEPCPLGLDAYGVRSPSSAGAFRTIEIINGNNLPSAKTLAIWDMFLQNGYRVAAVGGGDGHTAPRKQDDLGDAIWCMAQWVPGIPGDPAVGDCIERGTSLGTANHDKVGGSGRTLAHYPSGQVAVTPGVYSSASPADPARQAIRSGATVATNGPFVTAQVAGAFPGDTATIHGSEPVPVRVDWRQTFNTVGDTFGGADDLSDVDDFERIPPPGTELRVLTADEAPRPDQLVVVTGLTSGCGSDYERCADTTVRSVIDLSAPGPGVSIHDDWAEILVAPPGDDSYVRVEAYYELGDFQVHSKDDPTRYAVEGIHEFAAFTSPIYVSRPPSVLVDGVVLDAQGLAVEGAVVEVCRAERELVCATRTTGADGTFSTIEGVAGSWLARVFPPAGDLDHEVLVQSLGTLPANSSRTVTLQLERSGEEPPFIDPAGVVVDPFGNPLAGASVQLWVGEGSSGPFTPVPPGAAMMSPANRTNPMLSDEAGSFAWDVVAGFYRVTATKQGCVTPGGRPRADSGVVRVPPPVLDIELVLDCRPPDDEAPLIVIEDGPGQYTNDTNPTVRVSVADADPVIGTACLVDGRAYVDSDGVLESALPPCGDEFALGPLADGEHRLTVAAFDSRANIAIARRAFTVDTVAPTVTVSGVVEGGVYGVGGEMPSPACAASDDASGLLGPCNGHLEVPEGGVGEHRYVASASDRAGNTSTVAVSWAVVYPFDGFFPPVANPPVLNAVNAGRSIPIKFSLGGDRGLAVLAAGSPLSESIPCDDGGPVSEVTETVSAVAGALTYDAADDTYTYIWKTAKEWAGTCRLLRVDLVDGTTHTAVFGFR